MSGSFPSPQRTNDGGVGEGLEYSKCVISADAIQVTQSSNHFDDACVGQDPSDSIEVDLGTELEDEDHCTICLQPFLDRTIIPTCTHEFCFECILMWAEQSHKCPLCNRAFDSSNEKGGQMYLIHHIRPKYDYQKYYLPPRPTSPTPHLGSGIELGEPRPRQHSTRRRRERPWGRGHTLEDRDRERADEQLERAIARRKWVYDWGLYAKHVASNRYTRYRPFPAPAQFASSPDLISRMMVWLRRELRVWPSLDVEFLTTFTISLMKSIDIRSDSAVKLLAEFLDMDQPYVEGGRYVNAEHFAHEIYCYLRSPYRDLNTYDQIAQYDVPPDLPPPHRVERGNRWAEYSPRSCSSRSQSRSLTRSDLDRRLRRDMGRNGDSPSALDGCRGKTRIYPEPTGLQMNGSGVQGVGVPTRHDERQAQIFPNSHASTSAVRIEDTADDTYLPSSVSNPNLDPMIHSTAKGKGGAKGKQKEVFMPAYPCGDEFKTGERLQVQGTGLAGKENEVPLTKPNDTSIQATIATATTSAPPSGAGTITMSPSHWHGHTSMGANIPLAADENIPVSNSRTSVEDTDSCQIGTQTGDRTIPSGGPSRHRRRRLREQVQAHLLSRPVARQRGSVTEQRGNCATVAGSDEDKIDVDVPPSLLARLSDTPTSFSLEPLSLEPSAQLRGASNSHAHYRSMMDVSRGPNKRIPSSTENDKATLTLSRSTASQIRSVLLQRLEEEQRRALLSRSSSSPHRP